MVKGFGRVAIVEDFYNILQQIHNKDCLHACSKKTFARVYINNNNIVWVIENQVEYNL